MKRLLILPLALAAVLAGGAVHRAQDTCGPFTDVSPPYCPFVLEMYYLGITAGTSATTFSPDAPITRGQAAVFVSAGINQALARSSRRAALGQRWTATPQYANSLGVTDLGGQPDRVVSDGSDLWVPSPTAGSVYRVRASDGKLLETWTGATNAYAVLAAMGRVFVTRVGNPPSLYMIDPSQPAGDVTVVANNLRYSPVGITFDGSRIWTANYYTATVSIITPGSTLPWNVTTVTAGLQGPLSAIFDGANVWVTDSPAGQPGFLLKLGSDGSVLQSVAVGTTPYLAVFDGTHIWVPNRTDASVSVVRASTGVVDATLTGNGLSSPSAAAFDGSRILISNDYSVSLWNAASLAPLGSFSTAPSSPFGACSDGVNFWITLTSNQLARF